MKKLALLFWMTFAVLLLVHAAFGADSLPTIGGVYPLEPRVYTFVGEVRIPSGVMLLGVPGKTVFNCSPGPHGNCLYITGDNTTVSGVTINGAGIFIDRPSGKNTNINIDNCWFNLDVIGERNNAITFTSGLQDSKITNNYFTGYRGGFGIYGYNYKRVAIANNQFVNITAGMHIDAFQDSGDFLVEQNYFSGLKGMGIECQSTAVGNSYLDNWYENPNLSTSFHDNDGAMAFSLILDKSSNITIRRNVVLAPQRPDGVGCRVGFEVGGDNTLVEDNFVNGINNVLAINDGVGGCSVTVRNNRFLNYLEGPRLSFPAAGRSWTNTNNTAVTRLSDVMEQRIAAGDKPQRNRRYGDQVIPPVVVPPVVVPATLPAGVTQAQYDAVVSQRDAAILERDAARAADAAKAAKLSAIKAAGGW